MDTSSTAPVTGWRLAFFALAFALLGGVVGALVGLLVAPAPGNETRRRIARRSLQDQELLLRRAEMGMDLPWDEFDLPASA